MRVFKVSLFWIFLPLIKPSGSVLTIHNFLKATKLFEFYLAEQQWAAGPAYFKIESCPMVR